jgi:hypothetical protein
LAILGEAAGLGQNDVGCVALRNGDCAGAERRLNTLYAGNKKSHVKTVKASTLAQLSRRYVNKCKTGFAGARRRRKKR